MVKADGDYLVRYSGNKKCYVATTKWEGVIKHFAIQKSDEVHRTYNIYMVNHLSSVPIMLHVFLVFMISCPPKNGFTPLVRLVVGTCCIAVLHQ